MNTAQAPVPGQALDSDTSAVVAEINGDYLWDLAGSMTLPAEMSMCVFGPAPEVLFCSPSAPATLKEQRVGAGRRGQHVPVGMARRAGFLYRRLLGDPAPLPIFDGALDRAVE